MKPVYTPVAFWERERGGGGEIEEGRERTNELREIIERSDSREIIFE